MTFIYPNVFQFGVPFGAEDQEPKEEPKISAGGPGGEDPPKDDKQDEDSEDGDDPYAGMSAKELKRVIEESNKSRKDLETERDSFKSKIDEQERKQRTKEENLENDLRARDSVIETLRATNAKLAIISAIISDQKYSWHNPEVVAQQLDSKVVKVSDDGKVDGLKQELARVAKEHDYLLIKKGNSGSGGGQGSTGIQPGQGGADSKKSAAELAKNYPALLGRI